MKRWLPISIVIMSLAMAIIACNLGNQSPANDPNSPNAGAGTVISATSSIPTSTPQTGTGNSLPRETLILTQLGNPIAQLPDSGGKTVALQPGQFGSQASPDGRYGIRFTVNNNLTDLVLVDFTTGNNATKEIPQGKGLSGPGITWKPDSTGFAFFNFPPPENPKAATGNILYYEVGSGQTKELVPKPAEGGMIATSFAFSPNGQYLIYAVGSASGEGIGGPDSKLFVLNTTNNQATPLPQSISGFNQWLPDNNSFLVQRVDPNAGSQILLFRLDNLSAPQVLTPANTSDYLVDVSPDGKHLVVTFTPINQTPQPSQIAIMNPDGSNRKVLTKFTNADQSITGLIWGNSGIYYSITSAENNDTTWRVDLDGSNNAQVAQGTLNGIVGVR
jgi:hypothetical protein